MNSDFLIATTPRSPGTKGRLLASRPSTPKTVTTSSTMTGAAFHNLNFASLIVQPGTATHICFYVDERGMASVIVSPLHG